VRSGDGDALVALDIGPYHHVILVGGFAPYLREFMASGRPFTDLERDPDQFIGRIAERITLRPSIRTNHGPVTRVAGSAFFPRFH